MRRAQLRRRLRERRETRRRRVPGKSAAANFASKGVKSRSQERAPFGLRLLPCPKFCPTRLCSSGNLGASGGGHLTPPASHSSNWPRVRTTQDAGEFLLQPLDLFLDRHRPFQLRDRETVQNVLRHGFEVVSGDTEVNPCTVLSLVIRLGSTPLARAARRYSHHHSAPAQAFVVE